MKQYKLEKLLLTLVLLMVTHFAQATITGVVTDETDGQPIQGASIHIQTDPHFITFTADDGSFTLQVNPADPVKISAAIAYSTANSINYETTAVDANNGDNISILLTRIPSNQNLNYQPIKARSPNGCGDCHEDQLSEWEISHHADTATNSWVLDVFSGTGSGTGAGSTGSSGYVFTQTHDGNDTGKCAVCHAPNESYGSTNDPESVMLNTVSTAPGLEGITCSSCHQLNDVNENVESIHLLGNANFSFPLPDGPNGGAATHDYVWGPLDDVQFINMRAAWQPTFRDSRMCASCHEYVNPNTGTTGQSTYSEWLSSPYAQTGSQYKTCQDCHMPEKDSAGLLANPPVITPPIRPANQRHTHDFKGATPQRLQDAIQLESQAQINGLKVQVLTQVNNTGSGHNFPTGISIRNAFVHVTASLNGQPLNLINGPTLPYWLNDNVAGIQTRDLAGEAGFGYAKVLEGPINGVGAVVAPVIFIDANNVQSNTSIPAGSSDTQYYNFSIPNPLQENDVINVHSELIYRRAWRALAVDKGWIETPHGDPIETLVSSQEQILNVDTLLLDALFKDGLEQNPF